MLNKVLRKFAKQAAFMAAVLLTGGAANAYNVVNQTGQSKEFYGQFCPKCFHETIPNGAQRSCPADRAGCKNQTYVYEYVGRKNDPTTKFGRRCFKAATTPVNAYDTVVFSADSWKIYNESGSLRAEGQYKLYYEGILAILTPTDSCY